MTRTISKPHNNLCVNAAHVECSHLI